MGDTQVVDNRAPTTTLSERMRAFVAWVGKDAEEYPTGEHLTRADKVLEWADEVEALEDQLEAYRALDSRDFIDAEEAFARLEERPQDTR